MYRSVLTRCTRQVVVGARYAHKTATGRPTSIDTVFASAGCEVSDKATGAITPPIYLSTTFERDDNLEFSRGFNYSRIDNPTRKKLEETMTKIEGAKESMAFASGMQAATSLLMACPKAFVFLPDDLYHGVYVVLVQLFREWGMVCEKVDMTNFSFVEQRLKDIRESDRNRKVVLWLETPSNPKCKVTDIRRLCEIAKQTIPETKLVVAVDATWSTPYLLRPLELGADFVIHSATKYMGGHSDVLGGIISVGDTIGANAVLPLLKTAHQIGGGVCNPFDAWLILRGLRTLPVRMKQHCQNALELARYLDQHPSVSKVYYPGLPNHPQHELCEEQMGGKFGGMLSFLVKSPEGSSAEALQVVKSVNLFKKATSLGGTESLIEHRASVEGIYGQSPPNLLRVSVGLEEVEDLINDIDAALRKI